MNYKRISLSSERKIKVGAGEFNYDKVLTIRDLTEGSGSERTGKERNSVS